MHIQRNKRIYKGKVYKSVLLRQCYYEKGKIKQKTIANLSRMPEWMIRHIELGIKKDEVCYKLSDLQFKDGYSFGDIACLYELLKETGIMDCLYSRPIEEREIVNMMIIGRILHPSSKLENTRWIEEREEAFREIFPMIDYEKMRVDKLYSALDWIERRKKRIEKRIYEGREKPILFLYDTSSVYFEGEEAEIGEYGYNRDKKKGKKQIVIGLTMDEGGYPLSVEVFKGNTSDQKTIKGRIEDIKKGLGVERAIIIGDRGMITEARIEEIEEEGLEFITALTHSKIEELIKDRSSPFQLGIFDEKKEVEIGWEGRRYVLCKSKEREIKEGRELEALLQRTAEKLEKIKKQVERGKLKKAEKIGERVGRWKNKYKVGKYFETEIGEGKFRYWYKEEDLKIGRELLGCYVVVTNVGKERLSTEAVVERYRSLSLVDRAFRVIKTTLLNIHPIYHRKENRIRAHAMICMLAYYIVVEMKKRLRSLFDENGKGRNYALTFENILSSLNKIKIGYMDINGLKIQQLGKLTERQEKILKLLNIKIKVPDEVKH